MKALSDKIAFGRAPHPAFSVICAERNVNKSQKEAYNNDVEEITVSDQGANGLYITYLYNALSGVLARIGGGEELILGERAALCIRAEDPEGELREELRYHLSEIVGVGYKYRYLLGRLNVALSAHDKNLLCAALIAADYEADRGYIERKLGEGPEFNIDGIYAFRLGLLREKWEHIIEYVPAGFTANDLKQFCDFLVGESKNKIYLQGRTVFGENFKPLRRSSLIGPEDTETEIMLSDAGFVYCLGDVGDEVSDFLQKFYAERAIFS